MSFLELLRRNRNYRHLWAGQVVSEIGDYFNNIAVFSLALETTGSGLVVSAVMLSRAIPAVLAGPVAGVVLDRFDRRTVMIASDLVRGIVALAFLLTLEYRESWLLYMLSAVLMFASPFFTSGRAAILPAITSIEELHTANALTQTTQWATQTVGTLLAGVSAALLGYQWAFILNSISFLVSAAAIGRLRSNEGGFRARRGSQSTGPGLRPWHEYAEGLGYIKATPLVVGIAMLHVGWALGGGAAQILFTLFGEQVFHRGPAGIGAMWSFAGLGLLIGGAVGHQVGRRTGFEGCKHAVSLSYLVHGATYVAFSQAQSYAGALLLVMLSRVGMAVASVLNNSQLLLHTPDEYRGRVFSTMESARWATMIFSMAATGVATQHFSPRIIGVVAGLLACLTALAWVAANARGRLPEPARAPAGEVELRGEPSA